MDTTANRLTELEIRVVEQEKVIEELSDQLSQQWKQIDELNHRLSVLTKRFVSLEEQAAPDIPITKPPHW